MVQQYVSNKYGKDNVAHVSNINTITPKVFARDISRSCVLGGSEDSAIKIGTDIADIIPADISSMKSAFEKIPLLSEYAKKYPEIKKYIDIDGTYRAKATHAGGVIIAKRSLVGLVPIRKDKDESITIEYDKYESEENGLIKIDMLGLSTLDLVSKTIELIKNNNKPLPVFNYDQYDHKTYDLISKGDTFRVFQFSKGGAIELCKRIKPKSIEDLAVITTLIRPASKDIRDDFIKTRDGKKPIILLHPNLGNAFNATFGYPLYDENLLVLAKDIAGWDLHDADKLRKLTKEKGKNPEKVKQWQKEFIDGFIKNGINEVIASKIWDNVILPFGEYSFNKSISYLEPINIYNKNGDFIKEKHIKDVNVDDYVKSRDEKSKKDIFIRVTGIHDHGILPIVEVKLTSGEKVKCTINHKFRVENNGKMIPLWKIIEDNLIITVKSEYSKNIGSIKNIKFISNEQTYDLEVDHPDHQYYLANGILTSNSHAVLYSMLSYQTAYLKAHYPIEFLLADLMSEVKSNTPDAKDNIDKIKSEIRSKHVKILPPDINKSSLHYKMLDDKTLLTGLDSLKFVGDDAIIDIIEKRPFKDFSDFMVRIDSKKVRSTAIQALVASGCLDLFGITRKSIYLYCSDYRNKIKVWQKKHDHTKETFIYPWDKSEWNIQELYALEQHYLGESFICKPYKVYEKIFNLPHKPFLLVKKNKDRTPVDSMVGIIKDFFEFKVKKESSKYYGKPMIKAILEDEFGEECSLTIFPDKLEQLNKRIKELNIKTAFEPGLAIHFGGITNLYDDNMGIILDGVYNFMTSPSIPKDLKAKKISIKTVKQEKSDNLFEEIEDQMINDGSINFENL